MTEPRKQDLDIQKIDPNMAEQRAEDDGLKWIAPYDAPLRLAGFAWFEADRLYRRLPAKPAQPFPVPVDNLANSTAGGQIRFQSNATRIQVRVKLRGKAGMVHMPATGQCGFDVYVGPPGAQRYYHSTKYPIADDHYQIEMFEHKQPELRNFTFNFPLYQGVNEVQLGFNTEAELHAPPPYALDGRIVVYGTSITQGGCASRPGMAYPNILSRALNAEVLNLGFSGNGRGEPEVAQALAGIPASGPVKLWVLDYEANSSPEGLRETLPGFVDILRTATPTAPILVVSRIRYATESVQSATREGRAKAFAVQKDFVEARRAAGDAHIHFHDGGTLLGDEGWDECTVDGVHPNDLGFYRMAKSLEPVLRNILELPE